MVDEQVMQGLEGAAEAYPLALIEVAKLRLARPLVSLGFLGIMETKNTLRRRIATLVDRRQSVSVHVGVRGLLLWAAVGLALLPMAQAKTAVATPQTLPPTNVVVSAPLIQPRSAASGGSSLRAAAPYHPDLRRIFADYWAVRAKSNNSGATRRDARYAIDAPSHRCLHRPGSVPLRPC